ncbi:MAG: AAA family ATPase [Leptolyngbya sp. SIO4C1]|nr:AAA family ATPase [Leptolyngbya sp. SIO4C1]
MDLFDHHRQAQVEAEAPLAARMRPRTLADYVGQTAILGPGKLLRRAIQADQLSSLIFYGPPGTGKTTLARVIANTTQAQFISINAVLSGVKAIRDAIAAAQDRRGQFNQRTILFVDEVHRFNKAQQDALLPWVENGTVILIGATTENPYFEVNKALVSRSRLFQLQPLTADDLREIAARALSDPQRGYGDRSVNLEPSALDHLVNVANGDARALLNALELAVETTPPDAAGTVQITLSVAEDSIQQRAVLYDKEGDAHFDTISAFIKSLRGSDPDAALYWLARMVYAGEDPRFIFRRMLILAGEDVGLADPHAVAVVNSCAQAFDRIGLPEGRYPLAQAALYLATCPKSNSVMGFFDALAAVESEQQAEIPNPLKDASRDKTLGHGQGYLYPHAYRDHWVEQQYLPSSLQGQVFYQPSAQGYEDSIRLQVARRREAQLAALSETATLPELLTYGPTDRAQARWLQRAMGEPGERLAQIRDRVFTQLGPQRHHVVLDLSAGSGLLLWEAVRQVPEGGVYGCVSLSDYAALSEQIQQLAPLSRPILVQAPLAEIKSAIADSAVRFDGIIGRNALLGLPDKASVIAQLAPLLAAGGRLVLAESVPRLAQRLYALLPAGALSDARLEQLTAAEEAIYANPSDPKVNWSVDQLTTWFEQSGWTVEADLQPSETELQLTPALIERWFGQQSQYLQQLALSPDDTEAVRQTFRQHLQQRAIRWQQWTLFISGAIAAAPDRARAPASAAAPPDSKIQRSRGSKRTDSQADSQDRSERRPGSTL